MTSFSLRRPVLAAALLCLATLGAPVVAQETVEDVLAPLRPPSLFDASGSVSSSDNESGSGSSVGGSAEVDVTAIPLAAPGADRSCEFDGQRIRHRGAKYLAGRTHKRGSIYGSCVDGHLTCFEDNGIADAPQIKHVEVACDSRTINQRRRKLGVAVRLQEDVWPDGLIWYRINSTFSAQEKKIIREAIAVYESIDVKISFKECEPATLCKNKYVSFEQNEDACYSYVGYVDDGEPQIVNLGDSCFDGSGTAVHEIGHALGLYHEHTHPQREVIILTDSDLPVSASNYAKETDAIFKPYDKGSIMHYGRSAGLCLPKDQYPLKSFCDVEITTNCVMPVRQHCNTTRSKEIGQRTVLSAGDLNTLKALYGSTDGNNDNSLPVPIPDPGTDSDSRSGSGSLSGSSSTNPSSSPTPSPSPTTGYPSPTPTTAQLTPTPETASPSPEPSPSAAPSPSPVATTEAPTPSPTPTQSTARPTPTPTETPTDAPSETKTETPTNAPSEEDTEMPTEAPATPEPSATAAPVKTPEPTTTAAPVTTQEPAAIYPTPSAAPKPTTATPTTKPVTRTPSVTESPVYPVTPSTIAPTPKATAKKTTVPATAAPISGLTKAPSVYTIVPSVTVSPYVPGDVHGESSISGSTTGSNVWWTSNWITNAISKWTENVSGEYNNAKTSMTVSKTKTKKNGKTTTTKTSKSKTTKGTTTSTTTSTRSASSSSTKSSNGKDNGKGSGKEYGNSNGNGWRAYNSNNGLRGAGGY